MKHRLCLPFIVAVLCMSLPACQEDMESRSFVSKFRVLGVQTTPPEAIAGDAVAVSGIFAPVKGQAASVAFVTVDTEWIAQTLGPILPDNVDTFTTAELKELMNALMSLQGQTSEAAAPQDVLTPQFKAVVVPVNDVTGVATLPAENLPISPALIAVMKLLEQDGGLPVYLLACSNGTIDTRKLLGDVNHLTDSQAIGDLGAACKGPNATALVAFKAVNIRLAGDSAANTDPLNLNPRIQTFQIEKKTHPPNSPPGETGKMICKGTDGCRDPFRFQVSVHKEDFQYFQGFERRENEMEKMFVSWFSNGGEFSNSRIRSDDAQVAADAMMAGNSAPLDQILADPQRNHWFAVDWLPPVEGGVFDVWIVVNDLRGGIGYARYKIRAQARNY
ncbi:MAG: hypothetical protein JXR76_17230 [Deltaproteobacteria bacterium]|nr:hypothetical protein [Deltaproteobacteria bacterium]